MLNLNMLELRYIGLKMGDCMKKIGKKVFENRKAFLLAVSLFMFFSLAVSASAESGFVSV